MKEFTEDEKIIARNIDKRYKWIARDKFGTLCVYLLKPFKKEGTRMWVSSCAEIARVDLLLDKGLFKSIRWEDDEPTLIRDIYDPQVLDDIEREYLKEVLKPFHEKVVYVVKHGIDFKDGRHCDKEYLYIKFCERDVAFPNFTFPGFNSGKMYSGMELDKKYKLNELGIIYTD